MKTRPKPLKGLKELENELDCGSVDFWSRWWNARELVRPKIVSELKFGFEALFPTKDDSLAEELYENISRYFEDAVDFGRLIMLNEIKQRIRSAYEFYLRYKDNPELLVKEHPKYRAILRSLGFAHNGYFTLKSSITEEHYNEWLFKLAFADVLKISSFENENE